MEETISEDVTAGQQPADWNKPCSDEHLADISILIADWRAVSPFLGLTEAEEIAILESTHSVPARKMAMLRKWKQKKGRAATCDQLSRVFRKCERLDLVEKIKQILAESNSLVYGEGPSSNPPHPDPLTSYVSYLKELYTSMSHSHTSQHWTHLPRCQFIQLAMIKDEEVRRGGPEEEMIRLAQQGKIETILDHKENIALNQLFKSLKNCDNCPAPPPPSPSLPLPLGTHKDSLIIDLDLVLSLLRPNPRTILIEGAPGGGKSTLALHICHQWAQDASWLARFDIIVIAYLRNEAIQNASTLADILPAAGELSQSQNIVSHMQASYGKGVLFIFDGWDEFPPNLINNSLISTIIEQPHKLSLHRSTVLITSRPVASGNLLHIADRRVEILGFTQHQIREYIKKALDGNSTRIQKLIQHLEEHPVIEGYCYIPLHSAILVHIFLTMKGTLPSTLHELFCSLVLCCIVREHATHEPDTSLPELSSLDDLPDDLKSKLSDHCILAYNGVMQDKVVFFSKDLQKSNLPSNLSSLGLLQAVEGLTLTSKSCSYNFLHLSIQELLAAYHISQMPPSEQVKVFKNLFESSRFQAVLHYYCGFTKLDNPEIQEFISFHQHRNSSLTELLPLLHCFFEAQQPSLCQLVHPEFTTDVKLDFADISNPSDYIATGYFITSLLSTSTAEDVQFLIRCKYIDEHCLKLLLSQLSKYPVGEQPTACSSSKKLVFVLGTESVDLDTDSVIAVCGVDKVKYIPSEAAKLLLSHLKISPAIYISELVLYEGAIQCDEDGLLLIAEALQTNTTLNKLSLINVILQHSTKQSGPALIKMLRVNKALEYLDLSGNYVKSAIHSCIFEGLQHNTTLTHLILHKMDIQVSDPSTARSLTNMLQLNKTLTHLDLSKNCAFSQRGACCIFNSLQHNTTLTHLFLSDNYVVQRDHNNLVTVGSLNLMLQVNKSLTHLDLSKSINFTELEARCIFEGLQHSTTLVSLNLSSTGITATDPDTARSLTKMLQVNKSLTHLDLSSNGTHENSIISHTFKGLKLNTTLLDLDISYMTITDSDAECIAQAMSCNHSLQSLNICFFYVSDEGIHRILDSLKLNTSLKSLYMFQSQADTTERVVHDFKIVRKNSGLPPIKIVEVQVPHVMKYILAS